MELTVEVYRKLERLIESLPGESFNEYFAEYEIEPEETIKTKFSQIIEKIGDNISTSQYRKLWSAAELSHLFATNVSPFKVEVQKVSLSKVKKQIKNEQLDNKNLIALKLSSKPLLFYLSRTSTTLRSMMDKTVSSQEVRDSVYWLPELGILLTDVHTDETGELFTDILANQLIGNFEEYRIKSMIVTQQFKNERYINHLVVSAMAQITGFDGMDEIQFIGPDVKRGLGGLYRRQDIRVNLHEIGPNLATENKNLHLRVGNKLRIKRIEGIYDLHYLMYPEMYPTEQEMTELKEELDATPSIKISELSKRLNYEPAHVKLVLRKHLDMGKIRAKIENGQLIKI